MTVKEFDKFATILVISVRNLLVKYILLICFILSTTERAGVSIISYVLQKSVTTYNLTSEDQNQEENSEAEGLKKLEVKEYVDNYFEYAVSPSFFYFNKPARLKDNYYTLSLFKPSVPTPPPDLFI